MRTTGDNDFGTVFEAEIAAVNLHRTGDRLSAFVTIKIEEPDDDVLIELFKIAKKPVAAIFSARGIQGPMGDTENASAAGSDPRSEDIEQGEKPL
jgi:hypothetical protein